MHWYEQLQKIDRRIIYLLVAIVVALPILFPLHLPTYYTPTVQHVFDYLEKMKGDGVLLVSFNYDGSTVPELEPMVRSVIRHAFLRNIKVINYCWSLEGATLGERVLVDLANQYGKVWGVDYVNFGYKIPDFPIIMGMGSDIHRMLPTDTKGTPTDQIPMMKDIHSYDNIDLVMDFSASDSFYRWILYAHTQYKVKVAVGVTGVIAAEAFPLLQTEQLIGLVAGLKDAAEYEQHADEIEQSLKVDVVRKRALFDGIKARYQAKNETISDQDLEKAWNSVRELDFRARHGMDSQAIAHALIIAFIVIGNIGFLASRRNRGR